MSVSAEYLEALSNEFQYGEIVEAHKHRCYELSALRVVYGPGGAFPKANGYEGAALVHGTINHPASPPLHHGWVVEPDGSVWEPLTDTVYTARAFEVLFRPVAEVEYDVDEARLKMVTTGHYGSWH